jgi:hypothetical protein
VILDIDFLRWSSRHAARAEAVAAHVNLGRLGGSVTQ